MRRPVITKRWVERHADGHDYEHTLVRWPWLWWKP